MTYEEWIKSLELPLGVGVSASEAYQAGRDSMEVKKKEKKDVNCPHTHGKHIADYQGYWLEECLACGYQQFI